MPGGARTTDLFSGICCCHSDPTCIDMGGFIVTGTPNHVAQGLNMARLGATVIGYCGHPGFVIGASGKVSSGGIAATYVGAPVTGCLIGNIVTGSANYTVGL